MNFYQNVSVNMTFLFRNGTLNPVKAEGSESMNSLVERPTPPPPKKKACSQPNFNSLGSRRVKKMLKKWSKNCKKCFGFCLKQIPKCDTCFHTHFSRAFQKYSFQICSFSHKKVMGYFRYFFYTLQTFYHPGPVSYPMREKKNSKKSFKLLFMKSKKKFTVIVSKMRVLGQKNQRGAPNAPPPAFIGFIYLLKVAPIR